MTNPPPDESEDSVAPWDRPAGAAPPPRPAAPPAGSPRPAHAPAPPGQSRGAQLAATLLMLCALGGAVIGLLTYLKPTVEAGLVAVPVSQYRHIDWASNPAADADADRLRAQFVRAERANTEQEGRRLRELFDSLRERDDRRPLVVYLSSLAAVRDGQLFLIPGDARVEEPDGWVPVQELLDAMASCPVPAKALLLDLGRPLASPYWGPLSDDAPRALDELLTHADLTYPVLASCGPGEQSHFVREVGGSAFAVYLADGASGLADGAVPPHDLDGRVTFEELAEFATRRVAQWADRTLGVRQAPVLYGVGGEKLVIAARGRPAPPPPPPPADPAAPPPPPPPEPDYPAPLAAAWGKRDAVLASPSAGLVPTRLTEIAAQLLRAEGRLSADARLPNDALTKLPELFGRLDAASSPFSAGTLWELRAGRPPLSPELIAAFEKWREARAAAPPNPMAIEAAEQALDKPAAGKGIDLAGAVWDRLLNDRLLSAAKVKAAAELLSAGPFVAEPPPPSRELLLVRQLAAAPPADDAFPNGVRQLLRAEQALAQATSQSGAAVARVADSLIRADAAKRAAERQLLAPSAEPPEREAAARAVAEAAAQLEGVVLQGETFRRSDATLAQAVAALHGTSPGMVEANVPDEAAWRDAAEGAADLADRLARGDAPAALAAAEEKLRGRLAVLLTPFALETLRPLRESASKGPRADSVRLLRELLLSDALPAAERVATAKAAWKGAADLHRVLKSDLEEKQDRGTGSPAPSRPAVSAEESAGRTRRRASASLLMLRVAGFPKLDELQELHLQALQARSEAAPWLKLEERLRCAWGKELPAEAARALGAKEWARAGRVAPALPAGAGLTDFTLRPAAEDAEAGRKGRLSALFGEYRILRESFRPAAEFFDHLAWEAKR